MLPSQEAKGSLEHLAMPEVRKLSGKLGARGQKSCRASLKRRLLANDELEHPHDS